MTARYKFLTITFPWLRFLLFEVPITASALSASLLSLSLVGVFSKFQGEGPSKRSCERPIKKPVESTRLTRADIFARVYFPIHGHSLHSQLMPNTRPVLRILRLLLESQARREKGIATGSGSISRRSLFIHKLFLP